MAPFAYAGKEEPLFQVVKRGAALNHCTFMGAPAPLLGNPLATYLNRFARVFDC